MHRWKAFVVCVAACSSMLACGGDTDPAAQTQAEIDALREFATRYAHARCESMAACFTAAHDSQAPLVAANTSVDGIQCEDAMAFSTSRYEAAIAQGRMHFDASHVDAFLSAMATACDTWTTPAEDAYESLFVGTVGLGGACAADDECADGRRCDHAPGCEGTCVSTPTLGEACGSVADCRSDYPGARLDCAPSTSDAVARCVAVVTDVVGLGETCGWVVSDGPSQSFSACAPGLDCQPTQADPAVSTCVPPLALGAPCTVGGTACPLGARCLPDGQGGSACAELSVTSTAGDACGDALHVVCHPFARLACVADQCTVVGDGTLGSACRPDYPTDCDSGLRCGFTSRVCETKTAPVCP